MNDSSLKPPDICLNCKKPLDGAFCSNCGQNRKDIRVSVRSLLEDLAGSLFSLESKMFKSLGPLLTKPGFLTLAFMEGKRASFLPPVRMYLFFSILFFLSLASLKSDSETTNQERITSNIRSLLKYTELNQTTRNQLAAELKANDQADALHEALEEFNAWLGLQDSAIVSDLNEGWFKEWLLGNGKEMVSALPIPEMSMKALNSIKKAYAARCERYEKRFSGQVESIQKNEAIILDSFTISDARMEESTWWGKFFNEKVEERSRYLNEMDSRTRDRLLLDTFLQSVSKVMFLLMPVFALFLKGVYWRRDALYVDHLIFALHLHSFLFAKYSALIWIHKALGSYWPAPLTVFIILIGSPAYLWLAQKRVYRQSFWKTSFKFSFLSALYIPCLFASLLLALILAVFSM